MSTEKIFVANLDNPSHLALVQDFEQRNHLNRDKVTELSQVEQAMSAEVRKKVYLLQENEIIDCCDIQGTTDTKSCTLTFPQLERPVKNRKMISLASDYAFSLGMETLFVMAPVEDKALIQNLQVNGFFSMGEEGTSHPFMKCQTIEKESSRVI